jgi:GT2 family glycosyltransferase/glycosyltransferase involved in cell wall biosynthesis
VKAEIQRGLVSVVLVNFRGADDTITAIEELGKIDWPENQLEIVVVENASGDDSAERIAAAAPHVRLVVSKENLGFAGGCNLGVAHSRGEYVGFLNNDARPDAAWISAAVARFESSDRVGAVASRVLDWDGVNVDFIGAGLTWFGMGYKPFVEERFDSTLPVAGDVLFGTGSAMFVRREVFDELDGFDESFFMFFEDVDLGWRLNLRGWRYAYAPDSTAFHKHHASMDKLGNFKETYLLERNALYCLYKNLDDENLAEALPAALSLAVRRSVARGDLDSTDFDIRRGGADSISSIELDKQTIAGVFAIDQFVEHLPALRESRRLVQESRVVSDAKIWHLFGETDSASFENSYYLDGYFKIAGTFDVLDPAVRSRVLIITGDPIGAKLAGPAIRAWSIAEALSAHHEVTLMSLTQVEAVPAPFALVAVQPGEDARFAALEKDADVIIFQGHAMELFPALQKSEKILVADIYDPMHLEQLEQARELPREEWNARVTDATAVLNQQLARADYFICASERQRMFYLGQLAGLGRLNPDNYDSDPNFRGLIDVVPFGLPRALPEHNRDVLKGELAGIGEADKVLLWSGGLYNWFDPKTLIRAVAALSERRPEVKLFFQGTKHPHPGVPEMEIVAESRALANSLGVLESNVFFNDSWVDYADRHNYLLEADAGVSTHFSHIETTMSFRTRILDYLWATLPMVVTRGDVFADLIEREQLGLVVDAEDVDGLTAALERILFDEEFIAKAKANIGRVREDFFWDRVLAPLVAFVGHAHRSRDAKATSSRENRNRGPQRMPTRKRGIRHNVSRVAYYLRVGGPVVVLRKIRRRLTR